MALYPLVRPLVFALDAERAHRLTIRALRAVPAGEPTSEDPHLAIRVAGLDFPNPVGLAAGFDKDAEVHGQMLGFGFGFVEVGTVTPLPQAGNDRPRLFRLAEDRAVINRMGFNNGGFESARGRLEGRGRGIVGVNIGANKDSADRIADYAAGVRAMAPLADYLTVNISSPNTPGLRALQDKAALAELLAAVGEARTAAAPIFLKVAPDLEPDDIDGVARAAIEARIDALIVANTTVSRPALRSRHGGEAGGLSGAPLKALALRRLKDFRAATGGAMPLIAAGGIENGVDAYARIRAGASLVQVYTALVYQGPGVARAICGELRSLLSRDGFAALAEAVGADSP
ncbi:MAG TPA: quinone-dependent dihydroorotate dehydrogenase [Allosphingosinicella sp.]|jgi:dihydroorotate dehydrogenase|nr:quinone-dependent dihydroorotate dehydrogenase [Allosphingosinicella sp.]